MRRLLPGEQMGARAPMLGVALLCVLAAIVLYGLGRTVGAMTALVAAFLITAAAKRR